MLLLVCSSLCDPNTGPGPGIGIVTGCRGFEREAVGGDILVGGGIIGTCKPKLAGPQI